MTQITLLPFEANRPPSAKRGSTMKASTLPSSLLTRLRSSTATCIGYTLFPDCTVMLNVLPTSRGSVRMK